MWRLCYKITWKLNWIVILCYARFNWLENLEQLIRMRKTCVTQPNILILTQPYVHFLLNKMYSVHLTKQNMGLWKESFNPHGQGCSWPPVVSLSLAVNWPRSTPSSSRRRRIDRGRDGRWRRHRRRSRNPFCSEKKKLEICLMPYLCKE